MARSIWKGVISFGMVSIPVRLFTATETKDVAFHLLHKADNSRLKQKRWCPVDDREVASDEVVRGYEYAKDQFVLLTDEDFEKLPLASKHTIELTSFVEATEIDPVYYEKSYYLEPEEIGLKPYALLIQALREKGVTGLGKIALRNKERLCSLRPLDDGMLMLDTLFYPDEVRVQKGEKLPDVLVKEPELKMAAALIDMLAAPFRPEDYRDEYREALLELIESKLQGSELVQTPAAAPTNVTDLMEALRSSVAAARQRKEDPGDADEKPRKRRTAAA